jgi:hypothetical protein
MSLDGSTFLFAKRRTGNPTITAVTNSFYEVRRKVAEGAVKIQ